MAMDVDEGNEEIARAIWPLGTWLTDAAIYSWHSNQVQMLRGHIKAIVRILWIMLDCMSLLQSGDGLLRYMLECRRACLQVLDEFGQGRAELITLEPQG